jgi:hypothetical protein
MNRVLVNLRSRGPEHAGGRREARRGLTDLPGRARPTPCGDPVRASGEGPRSASTPQEVTGVASVGLSFRRGRSGSPRRPASRCPDPGRPRCRARRPADRPARRPSRRRPYPRARPGPGRCGARRRRGEDGRGHPGAVVLALLMGSASTSRGSSLTSRPGEGGASSMYPRTAFGTAGATWTRTRCMVRAWRNRHDACLARTLTEMTRACRPRTCPWQLWRSTASRRSSTGRGRSTSRCSTLPCSSQPWR